MSSSIYIPNMTLLACKVVEKSLTKKCYGITEGRTDGRTDGMTDRSKPVYPPLFQSGGITNYYLVILSSKTCFEVGLTNYIFLCRLLGKKIICFKTLHL